MQRNLAKRKDCESVQKRTSSHFGFYYEKSFSTSLDDDKAQTPPFKYHIQMPFKRVLKCKISFKLSLNWPKSYPKEIGLLKLFTTC